LDIANAVAIGIDFPIPAPIFIDDRWRRGWAEISAQAGKRSRTRGAVVANMIVVVVDLDPRASGAIARDCRSRARTPVSALAIGRPDALRDVAAYKIIVSIDLRSRTTGDIHCRRRSRATTQIEATTREGPRRLSVSVANRICVEIDLRPRASEGVDDCSGRRAGSAQVAIIAKAVPILVLARRQAYLRPLRIGAAVNVNHSAATS
jgi:hypothetical protein